jgi:hypothetical protein
MLLLQFEFQICRNSNGWLNLKFPQNHRRRRRRFCTEEIHDKQPWPDVNDLERLLLYQQTQNFFKYSAV